MSRTGRWLGTAASIAGLIVFFYFVGYFAQGLPAATPSAFADGSAHVQDVVVDNSSGLTVTGRINVPDNSDIIVMLSQQWLPDGARRMAEGGMPCDVNCLPPHAPPTRVKSGKFLAGPFAYDDGRELAAGIYELEILDDRDFGNFLPLFYTLLKIDPAHPIHQKIASNTAAVTYNACLSHATIAKNVPKDDWRFLLERLCAPSRRDFLTACMSLGLDENNCENNAAGLAESAKWRLTLPQ
jgi:hypothetical protein